MISSNEAKSTCGNPADGRNNNNNDSSKLLRIDSGEQVAGADAENVYNLPSKKEDEKMENKQEERSMHPTTRIPFGHLSVHIPGLRTGEELRALEAQERLEGGLVCTYKDGVYTFPGLHGEGDIMIREQGKSFYLDCGIFKGSSWGFTKWSEDHGCYVEERKHIKACLRLLKANRLIKRRAMPPEDQNGKGGDGR